MDQKPVIHSDNVVQQAKDSGRIRKPGPLTGLLMRCLDCFLRSYVLNRRGKYSYKATIKSTMENRASPLMTLPQSKLVENTTKFIQSKIDSESLTKDWLCFSIWSLAPTKLYKSQNQYFPTENLPLLEPDALLLDISTRGRCSVKVKQLEFLEKRACKLVGSICTWICSLQQPIYASSKSPCQSQLCLDSWRLWPNPLDIR